MRLLARVRALFLADAPPGNINYALERSFSLAEGIRRFRNHRWRKRDFQWVIIGPLLLFCFTICEKPTWPFKLIIMALLGYAVTVPALSQFWLNFMPTGAWLILFYSCRYIPPAWRPSIYVRVLPGLESIFYGGNLSAVLASKTNTLLDILAWIPYGLIHFGAPFVVSILCFLFGPPTTLRVFMFAFGWMNLIGVFIQISFPTAPPWYQTLYGLQKANYGMAGSAGGLTRIDQLLGVDMYTSPFAASPQVFGAMPSLHSGSAVMEYFFMSYLFPQFSPVFAVYVMWIWWSTMYLTHHYFVDLMAGALLSITVFYICKVTILPQKLPGKFGRWSYDEVFFGMPQPAKAFAMSHYDHESDFELQEISRPPSLPPSRPPSRPGSAAPIIQRVSRTSTPRLPEH